MNWLRNSAFLSSIFLSSIALNGLMFGLGARWVGRRGGVQFLRQVLTRWQTHGSASYLCANYLHRQQQLEQLPIEPDAIVFLGDSLTQEAEWSEWFPQFNIKNRGISGDTTSGLIDRLTPILVAKPQKLFLMIGINDLLNEHRSSAAVAQSYQHILSRFQNQTPATQVVVQSVLPINANLCGKDLCGKQLRAEIEALNQVLQTIATQHGYTFLNLFPLFLDSHNQLSAEYTLDGIHLNGKGYRLWAQQLQIYLESE